MNPGEDRLSDALHELAAASPGPSAELSTRLHTAFQKHHRRRRVQRAVVTAVLALCVVMAGAVSWMKRPVRPVESAKQTTPAVQQIEQPQAPQMANVAEEPKKSEAPRVVARSKAVDHAEKKVRQVRSQAAEPVLEAGDFVALPTFDPSVPQGLSRMVRMELPGPELQLMGYPLDGQLMNRRVVTDVLVGQDGMPYAVRLVNARN